MTPTTLPRESHVIIAPFSNGAKISGFEMSYAIGSQHLNSWCWGPNQNTSRIQCEKIKPHFVNFSGGSVTPSTTSTATTHGGPRGSHLLQMHVVSQAARRGAVMPQRKASQSQNVNQNGATSGFEMCFCYQIPAPLVQGVPKRVSNPAYRSLNHI